jgi:hypothetical protein
MMMNYGGADRREFFRINDTVVIDYKAIADADIDRVAKRIAQSADDDDNNDKAKLKVLQNSLNHLIDQVNYDNREIARALRLMDEKINILAESVQRQTHPINPDELIEANLSGGGLAFMTPEAIDTRSHIELHLKLLPTGSTIHAMASVISCDRLLTADPARPYHLRLVFTHMDEQDRNLLVKHTLNRQAEVLRGGFANEAMTLREF